MFDNARINCCEEFKAFKWQFNHYKIYSYCPYCGQKVELK